MGPWLALADSLPLFHFVHFFAAICDLRYNDGQLQFECLIEITLTDRVVLSYRGVQEARPYHCTFQFCHFLGLQPLEDLETMQVLH